MAGIFIVLLALAVGLLGNVLNGYVLSILWGWFLVPLGLPEIGVITGIGICIIANFVTYKASDFKEIPGERSNYIGMFLTPLVVLLVGWIFHSFM